MTSWWKGLAIVAGSAAAGSFGQTFADPTVWTTNAKGAAASAGMTVVVAVASWLIRSPRDNKPQR